MYSLLLCVAQVAVVSAFAQTLRRYTSLNHLAQAARAVLQNTSQINQMLSDLNRVDFANVQVNFSVSFPVHPKSNLHVKMSKVCAQVAQGADGGLVATLCFPSLTV